MSTERDYPTDLSDEQWEILQELLPKPQWEPGGRGRPPVDRRRVINGIFSLKKTGCQWRMLPKDFGHWSTVYGYFKRWRCAGVWVDLMKQLRQRERIRQGRKPEPSAASIDSQSIKGATQEKDAIGFDGNKKVKGRKRHILVDTLGLIIAVVVTAANVDDRQGFKQLVEGYFADGVKRLRKIWVDGGYQAGWLQAWVRGLKRTHKIAMEITDHEGKGFQVVPWRWAVERTFSWLRNDRRHSRDYERLPANSEVLIQISMIHLLLKRLA
jgi:putative transposase